MDKDKNFYPMLKSPISLPGTQEYKNLSWLWGVDKKSIRGSLFGITRLCQLLDFLKQILWYVLLLIIFYFTMRPFWTLNDIYNIVSMYFQNQMSGQSNYISFLLETAINDSSVRGDISGSGQNSSQLMEIPGRTIQVNEVGKVYFL